MNPNFPDRLLGPSPTNGFSLCVAMDTFGDTALINFEEQGLGSTVGSRSGTGLSDRRLSVTHFLQAGVDGLHRPRSAIRSGPNQ
jgi:hypothetical protein